MESRDEAPDVESQVKRTWHVIAQLLALAMKETEETSPNWDVVTQLLDWVLQKIDESPELMTADLRNRLDCILFAESPVPQAPAAESQIENNCDHVKHVRTEALEIALRMAGTSGTSSGASVEEAAEED